MKRLMNGFPLLYNPSNSLLAGFRTSFIIHRKQNHSFGSSVCSVLQLFSFCVFFKKNAKYLLSQICMV